GSGPVRYRTPTEPASCVRRRRARLCGYGSCPAGGARRNRPRSASISVAATLRSAGARTACAVSRIHVDSGSHRLAARVLELQGDEVRCRHSLLVLDLLQYGIESLAYRLLQDSRVDLASRRRGRVEQQPVFAAYLRLCALQRNVCLISARVRVEHERQLRFLDTLRRRQREPLVIPEREPVACCSSHR